MTDQPDAPAADTVPDEDLPEQMQVRRDKRARLLASGVEAYPVTAIASIWRPTCSVRSFLTSE